MKTLKSVCWIGFTICLSACATRTVYVPAGTPVQFAEPVKNAKVWVPDKNGTKIKSTMTIPEGWWTLEDTKK